MPELLLIRGRNANEMQLSSEAERVRPSIRAHTPSRAAPQTRALSPEPPEAATGLDQEAPESKGTIYSSLQLQHF